MNYQVAKVNYLLALRATVPFGYILCYMTGYLYTLMQILQMVPHNFQRMTKPCQVSNKGIQYMGRKVDQFTPPPT